MSMTSTTATPAHNGPMLYHAGANMISFSEGKECKKPECVEMWVCYCAENKARAEAAEAICKPVEEPPVRGNPFPRTNHCILRPCHFCTKMERGKRVTKPVKELFCNFDQFGDQGCKYGPNCAYIHEKNEDYEASHRLWNGEVSNWNGVRTLPCRTPGCKGEKCTFGHPERATKPEKTVPICRDGVKCKNDKCQFGHSERVTGPKKTVPICRDGVKCTRGEKCTFGHPERATNSTK